jgi:hypothetical protein
MFKRRDRNCIEDERRAGPATERNGKVSPIHLNTVWTAPAFYFIEMILEVMKVVLGSILEEWIQESLANIARRVESWVGMSAVYTVVGLGHFPEGQTIYGWSVL